MGRIELKHFPASKLPDELRGAFVEGDFVNITVEVDATKPMSREDLLKMLRPDIPREKEVSLEESVKRIRELRDEWDD
jgi:hypothetical protein